MKKNTVIIILLFIVLILQNFLQTNVSSLFSYFDEFIALLAIPIFLFKNNLIKSSKIKKSINKESKYIKYIVILLILFNIIGIISTYLYHYQPLKYVIKDIITINKFFLAIYTSFSLFELSLDNVKDMKSILKISNLFTIILFGLFIIDILFKVFPHETRYGFRAEQLFYSHPTFLCGISIFLLLLNLLLSKKCNLSVKYSYLIILSIIIISTLRTKAIIFILFFWFLYFILYKKNRKLKLSFILILALLGFLLGMNQFENYFIKNESARSMLFEASFKIADDHFPLGSGFASYGSDASKDNYSILYYNYGLNTKFGLSPMHPYYISDNFWPMIIGQFGYFGCIIYILILFMLYKIIQTKFDKNIDDNINYFILLNCLIYPVIMSTSVSAFVAPTSVPFSILIGSCLKDKNKLKECDDNEK